MLIGKKEFIAGILMATISVSAATKLTSLYAVENGFSSEVEFSQRIGLFDSERLSEKTLQSNIAEIAFYRGLNLILVDKGIVSSFNPSKLEGLGITTTAAPMCSITRQKATETIFRALMFANSRGIISIPTRGKDIAFMDWTPNEKYQDTAVFAIKNSVLKGVGQNVFRPSKKLTVREALILLQRLYELDVKQVAFDTANEQNMGKADKKVENKKTDAAIPQSSNTKTIYIEPEVQKFFKDISNTNPMADTMKKLINAGAFDLTNLNHEANLPKSIKVKDFVKVCKGMMNKAGKPEVCKQIDAAVRSTKGDEAISRNTVAMVGSAIVDVYAHNEYNVSPNYSDVAADSNVGKALQHIAKAGIRMGYPDGSFKGTEKVSRYEAFNLLNIIVGDNVGTRIKITTVDNSKIPALQPAVEKDATPKTVKQEPQKTEAAKPATAQSEATTKASKLEQQLSEKYEGLSFRERIEMRKAQFQKILNREE